MNIEALNNGYFFNIYVKKRMKSVFMVANIAILLNIKNITIESALVK